MNRVVPGGRTGDEGVTLVDVIVATGLMALFMAMFTASILQVYRAVDRNQSVSSAGAQVNNAFLRVDKEIRYASAVSQEGQVGVNWYVEYLLPSGGTPSCVELRVSGGQLQRRTWAQGASPLVPTAWMPLASGLGTGKPFTFTAPASANGFQRLEVKLSVTDSGGATRQTDVTFTAMNSSGHSADPTVCTEGRAVP
jgi:hypothetical protein